MFPELSKHIGALITPAIIDGPACMQDGKCAGTASAGRLFPKSADESWHITGDSAESLFSRPANKCIAF